MDYTIRDLAFVTLQSLPEAIVIIDEQTIVQLINDAACHLLKTTSNDAVGIPFTYLPKDQLKTSSSSTQVWFSEVDNRQLVFKASRISESDKRYIRILLLDQTPEELVNPSCHL
jgi:sensor histidine kinase regulating citrate/malate metabolism